MKKILIVVVLYNENIYSTQTYNTLIKEAKDCGVYVYDNSPYPQHNLNELPSSWVYISDVENHGLSYAYNKAAQFAKANNYEWILIADQDTIFAPNSIDEYLVHIQEYPAIKLFAPLIITTNGVKMSPMRINHYLCINANICVNGVLPLCKYSPINSGMLIDVDAFIESNGYDNNVFLDYSDFQFINNFQTKYKYMYLLPITCIQNFSNDVIDVFQLHNRYNLFCRSLKHFKSSSALDKIGIHLIVFKRAISLTYKTCSIKPLSIFFNSYIL